MRSPMAKATLIFLVLAALSAAVLALAVRSALRVECEACVTFAGRTACRTAAGRNEDEAKRTAVENACAFLASGMTEVVSCTTASPATFRCE